MRPIVETLVLLVVFAAIIAALLFGVVTVGAAAGSRLRWESSETPAIAEEFRKIKPASLQDSPPAYWEDLP